MKILVYGRIREGKASVTKEDLLGKSVTIEQDDAWFVGSYEESPNGVYLVAFSDGYIEKIGAKEKWINGQVCLVKNLKTVVWVRELERPNECAVSNNGRVAVNDWLKAKRKLGGKFYIFDQSGRTLLEKQFDSNLCACAISEDGNYAATSTAFPDNSIYLFDVGNSELKWVYKNHDRNVVLGLSISGNKVKVWTGKSTATRKYSYSLDFEGKLSEEDFEKLRKIRIISHGAIREAVGVLIGFLTSSSKDQVREGLRKLRALTYRFKKYEKLLTPYVSPYLLDEDEEISQLSEDIILNFSRRDPDATETAVRMILKRMEERPSGLSEKDLRILGMLGRIRPQWVKNKIPKIINALLNSKEFNVRRFAAYALGEIGSADPEAVKEAVPILIRYLGNSDWWLPHIKKEKEEVSVQGIRITLSYGENSDSEAWIRNAAIEALGNIGEKKPEIVKDAIPLLVSCLKRPESYTRRKAVEALGRIAKRGRAYVELVIPVLERTAEEDPDERVKLEAGAILKSISPEVAERSVSNIPHLINDLSSKDKIARYEAIRELERIFHIPPSLPPQQYHKALLIMDKSSSRLMQCITKIQEELSTSKDKIARLLLLESLMRAKRSFLEFIVGEHIGDDSIRCKFCGKIYKTGGIRNHLARKHPEEWKKIRPYDDVILQYLEIKNQSGLTSEEWERKLLEEYKKTSGVRHQ